jgi:hypothetical protein
MTWLATAGLALQAQAGSCTGAWGWLLVPWGTP